MRLDRPRSKAIHRYGIPHIQLGDEIHGKKGVIMSARRGEHLRLALFSMDDVLVDERHGIVDPLTVPWIQRGGGGMAHAPQQLHISGHVALARVNDRRRSAQDVIARVQRSRCSVKETEMVTRMSR